MSNLINFDFQSQTVRVELKNGEPLFCLTDVATILEITNANPSRFNLSNDGVHKMYSVDSKGRKNEITFINEPNLYRVIFRSNKKEAVKFQNWVFDEVLPSIRKTGSYHQKTTPHDRTPLRQAVSALVGKLGIAYDEAYNLVHQYMGVSSIDEILLDDLPKAVAYVHSLLLHPPKTTQSYLTQEDAFTFAKVLNYARLYADIAPKMVKCDGTISTMFAKNSDKDDEGFFVCYRPKYKEDLDKALTLFIDLINRSYVMA